MVAMTLIMPLLTVLADLIGCFGDGLISMIQVDLTAQYVLRQMLETIGPEDLIRTDEEHFLAIGSPSLLAGKE